VKKGIASSLNDSGALSIVEEAVGGISDAALIRSRFSS
jgi:hypothetical protein